MQPVQNSKTHENIDYIQQSSFYKRCTNIWKWRRMYHRMDSYKFQSTFLSGQFLFLIDILFILFYIIKKWSTLQNIFISLSIKNLLCSIWLEWKGNHEQIL